MVSPGRSVLFRLDADWEVGLGHLRRCLSLAAAISREGGRAILLLAGDEQAVRFAQSRGVLARGLPSRPAWGDADLALTLAEARAHECTTTVVDSDAKHDGYLRALRSAGQFVCALDDGARYDFSCQMVVNGDAHAGSLAYRSSSGDTQFLLGPEYALLREEFWETQGRQEYGDVHRVLLTLGGSDRHGLTPRLLRVLDGLPGAFAVTVIVGPFFTNRRDVELAAAQCRRVVTLQFAPEEIRDLMLEADLAVSAGGQTLYELACAGCPAVVVTMADNQLEQVRAFAEANTILPAGHVHDPNIETAVASTFISLQSSPERRLAMSEAGRRMVDGQGARRVARFLFRRADAHGKGEPGT